MHSLLAAVRGMVKASSAQSNTAKKAAGVLSKKPCEK
jgi:hypothetical protein